MRNTQTVFPNGVDELQFFSDISIDQVPIMENYLRLLNSGNYTSASEYLKNSGVFYYGAWFLNMMENRLRTIGNYLTNLEDLELVTYSDSEPSESEVFDGISWIR